MTIRETVFSKLHKLPESLIQEVNDFIDFIAHKHQSKIIHGQPETPLGETWSQWFKAVDDLVVNPSEPEITYPQLLLNKYRQQGLDL
jgi:hypothetical protein